MDVSSPPNSTETKNVEMADVSQQINLNDSLQTTYANQTPGLFLIIIIIKSIFSHEFIKFIIINFLIYFSGKCRIQQN